jgi:hypothetical protein
MSILKGRGREKEEGDILKERANGRGKTGRNNVSSESMNEM